MSGTEDTEPVLSSSYTGATAQLIMLGDRYLDGPHDYLPMGFTRADLPELTRLAQDMELGLAPYDENDEPAPQAYAPIHAWRILGQLQAPEAIPVLLSQLHLIDDEQHDYADEHIPRALARIGLPAIEPCRRYLLDAGHHLYARLAAANALQEIARLQPESRPACLDALLAALREYRTNDPVLNAFILSYLADMHAVEAGSLAREAFAADRVDLSVAGDYEDFQVEVGLLKERRTKRDFGKWRSESFSVLPQLAAEFNRMEHMQAGKKKEKHKQEKKARKRHRKK